MTFKVILLYNVHNKFVEHSRRKHGLALRKWLHSMLLKDRQNVQEHVKNMIELFNEFPIVGDNISDEDRVVYEHANPTESFNMLVTALEASSTVPMETVIERLLHTERMLKDKDLTNPSDTEGAIKGEHSDVVTWTHPKKLP